MEKKDRKMGEEKERKDQRDLEKEKVGSEQPQQENREQVVKGKLKWSKEEEEKREKEQKSTEAVSTEESKQTPEMKQKPKSEQKQEQVVETTKKEAAATGAQETGAKKEPAAKNKKNKYTIEDTLGPIDFKEYSIDPETEKEEKATAKEEVKAKEKSASSKEQAEKEDASQDTKPFVFSSKDDPQPELKKSSDQQRRGKKKDSSSTTKRSSNKWKLALKILWLPVVLIIVLIVSLIVGHTMIGDQPASDVFDLDMWLHLYKLIFTK